jgi:hypothetical protein
VLEKMKNWIKKWVKIFMNKFHKRKSPNPVTNFEIKLEDKK